MPHGQIIVLGGGFAGLRALNRLSPLRKDYKIILVDKKETSDFLPCLPDIVGRGVKPGDLTFNLNSFCTRKGFEFIREEVIHIDIPARIVETRKGAYPYDYLIAAPGSQTNFYGNNTFAQAAYTLGNVENVAQILKTIGAQGKELENFIIAGGGYTGIEIAASLWRYFASRKTKKKIYIIEKTDSLLGPLPPWMKEYTQINLKTLGIEVVFNNGVEQMRADKVVLSDGRQYEKAMLIWTAGVKTPDFIQELPVKRMPQGRVPVDAYLRLNDSTYILGDCAYFEQKGNPLRMAIQFSIAEGELAAENIARSIKKQPLRIYNPVDLGYIIPMANNRSCGQVFGIKLKGVFPTFLHYFMCVYRSRGWRNKWGLLRDLTGIE